jgi:hypothetical protein
MFTEVADSLTRAVVVVPSDTNPLSAQFSGPNPPAFARRLWCGEGGTVIVTVVTLGGDTVTYTMTTPDYIRMKCLYVKATGTTAPAGTIVAEY